MPDQPQRVVLDWRTGKHFSNVARPCRYCRKPTQLRDEDGVPAHKICAEAALTSGRH